MTTFLSRVDLVAFLFLNDLAGRSDVGDAVIRFCAAYLLYVMIAAALIFAAAVLLPRFRAMRRKNIEMLFFAAFSAFIARIVIAEPIRWLIARQRPFEMLADARQLVDHSMGAAFPSGHASLAFGIAAGLAYYYPKTSIVFFAAAVLVGAGRVSAGVHWPSDIAAGAVVGIAGAWLARRMMLSAYLKNSFSL